MRNKEDLINLATREEKDRLVYLIDKLPLSYYFGDLLDWSDIVSELGGLAETLKRRKVLVLESTQTSGRVATPMALKIAGPDFFTEDNRRTVGGF